MSFIAQEVWATTTMVGCGIAVCGNGFCGGYSPNNTGFFIVCDYGPGGNLIGSWPYCTPGGPTPCAGADSNSSTTPPSAPPPVVVGGSSQIITLQAMYLVTALIFLLFFMALDESRTE